MCDKHLGLISKNLSGSNTETALPSQPVSSINGSGYSGSGAIARSGRFRLWEIKESIHCSVIGTCASVLDIKRLAAKVGIQLIEDASDYVVHGYLVHKSSEDTPFARAFQKLMDSRFAGALRKVKRLKEFDEFNSLWDEMRDNGQIAAAYWAFMTSANVPVPVRERIYGEVHMLSHLAGANYAKKSNKLGELELELARLNDKLEKAHLHKDRAIESRDNTISELFSKLEESRRIISDFEAQNHVAEKSQADSDKAAKRIAHLERALQMANQRASLAENKLQNNANQGNHTDPSKELLEIERPDDPAQNHQQGDDAICLDKGKSAIKILYLGGRSRQIPHLRSIAEEQTVELVHHDGGKENSVSRIDSVLPSVDCVMCPIDCISHDACLRAKQSCHKLKLPFVPLRTSSATAFKEALKQVKGGML